MAKYRVLNRFTDKYTKEIYDENSEIEITIKRADEIIDNLSIYDREFLERIDNK